jgi:F-type H+-transporting ATPase subunit gamma
VICSNRGLCGGYNTSILRVADQRLQQYRQSGIDLHLELSGKRAIAYYRYHGVPFEASYTHFEDKPRFEEVEVLANRYLEGYLGRRYDQVEVAYMKFLSASRQTPVVETLLPLSTIAPAAAPPGNSRGDRFRQYRFRKWHRSCDWASNSSGDHRVRVSLPDPRAAFSKSCCRCR